MFKFTSFLAWVSLVTGLLVVTTGVNASPMYKCKVGGTVTYQQDPCPTGQVRKLPTVQELNASEKKRREAVVAPSPETFEKPEKPVAVQEKAAADTQSTEKRTLTTSNPSTSSTPSSSFSCDGRRYCSQMKSCAEAKYFLAYCPGVKMDGDKNGTPCEKQWCSR
jgi:septal ring-binding cell division protein DamX